MADRSFLAWPFFEDRHRDLAGKLEHWAKVHLPVDHADVDTACIELVRKLGEAGWLWHTGSEAGEALDVRTLCLIRGMIAQSIIRVDPAYYAGLLDFWKRDVRAQLSGSGSGAVVSMGQAWKGRA
jgi:acyl-CoA dehydrogenase